VSAKSDELLSKINKELIDDVVAGKIQVSDFEKMRDIAFRKIPEIDEIIKSQSKLSASLALGYMALTQSAEVYGQAIEAGYDKRTAGFASLVAAGGQYWIMSTNEMGTWFLDKSTGYDINVNKALMRKTMNV